MLIQDFQGPNLVPNFLCLLANGFRFYFTRFLTLLFTFPSRYLFTIGRQEYLALGDGSPRFSQGICPMVLRILLGVLQILPTGLSPSLADNSMSFSYPRYSQIGVLQPPALSCERAGFRLYRFRSPLLTASQFVFFSSPYLDVSVRVVPSTPLMILGGESPIKSEGLPHSETAGSKNARFLPDEYRHLQRPSSALATKASTVCFNKN